MRNKHTLKDNINTILEFNTRMKQLLFFVVMVVFSFRVSAQNDDTVARSLDGSSRDSFYKVISYGDRIAFGTVEEDARWTIINTKENRIISLYGNQINGYVFDQPGTYEVSFSEIKKQQNECSHPSYPDKMVIKVNPVKMTFDFSKINFSEKIQRGRNCDDIVITVPVTIAAKDNSVAKLNAPGLTIAGIGSNLTAKPLNGSILIQNGVQVLRYQLSGSVDKESYLMFDFFDLNNQVQTYNLPDIVN